MSTISATDHVAALMDIGPREEQQDRAIAHVHEDGSWVVAVFDGLGGHARGDEAAQAAAAAFPNRIDGAVEMHTAVNASNDAVWALVSEDDHVSRKLGMRMHWPDRSEPLTTIAAAAWTPQSGLVTGWLGDSVMFFVPVKAGIPGMHSEPHGPWDSYQVDNGLGFSFVVPEESLGTMSDEDLGELNGHIDGDGLLVIAATDGLFDPIRLGKYGRRGRFSEDSADNSIGFAIPSEDRLSAHATAAALMNAAVSKQLRDNAAVAVALARRNA